MDSYLTGNNLELARKTSLLLSTLKLLLLYDSLLFSRRKPLSPRVIMLQTHALFYSTSSYNAFRSCQKEINRGEKILYCF